MTFSTDWDKLSTSEGYYVIAKVVDSQKLHASKLQYLINIHWKLQGWILVVKQLKNNFLLKSQFKKDATFMLDNTSWLLRLLSLFDMMESEYFFDFFLGPLLSFVGSSSWNSC